jgi:mRNA interferase YafQ
MFNAIYTKRFEKDLKLAQKRGKKLKKLMVVMKKLLNGEILPLKYQDHWLTGNYINRRECHVEPDWLLIYQPRKIHIVFERLGSHSDLFK